MKANIFVQTGEVWATGKRIILRSDTIGSCGAVVAYDIKKKIGALAHIMLPGHSSKKGLYNNTKYAGDAIDDLLFKMARLGTEKDDIKACLLGGGNVLRDENDKICKAVIDSIIELLNENGIEIVAKAVGGTVRRGVSLDIEDGRVSYFEGDSDVELLYSWGEV